MSKLFIDSKDKESSLLTSLCADYCIDTSWSTAGQVLRGEILSAQTMSEFLKHRKIIGWDSVAKEVSAFSSLRCNGRTEPSTFVPLVNESKCLVIYTDGQIASISMNTLENKVSSVLDDIPIIVVFALPRFNMTIEQMQGSINMSVPEAFLRLSNNVMILITNGPQHKILMTKGCFSIFRSVQLSNNILVNDLTDFYLESFKNVSVMGSLPSNLILLDGYDNPLDLNVLYISNDVPTGVLKALCNRMHLPRLDLDMMHSLLIRLNHKLTENHELQTIREKLSQIAVSDKAGSAEHRELISHYNKVRGQKNSVTNKEKLKVINNFLAIIADYRLNNTSIVLGSNRANRAVEFNDNDLDDIGKCSKIECKIMMDTGDACILIKVPDKTEFLKEFTADYAMESPFEFGTWLTDFLTPGIFCYDIAKDMETNPYTREKILGFIPLSENPTIIMKHMSKLFGGNRELWHMVRGYISMMVHACDKEWMDKKIIYPHLKKLFSNYNATIDLKGGSCKVPLNEAFENVLKNYSVCLRDRTPNDVRAIMKISKAILPEIKFEETKINGMISVIEIFLKLLNAHKKNEDMTKYVMETDNYEHYVKYKSGLEGLIGQIFWRDFNNVYRKLKLQTAVDKALNHKKLGKCLRKAFLGENFDESILELALPEPTGVHFCVEKYGSLDSRDMPELTCTFCGKEFKETILKYHHLRTEMGAHFYNGHLSVKHAIYELGLNSSERNLFIRAKNNLYRQYGKQSGFLHTKRCKSRLLQFINQYKKVNTMQKMTSSLASCSL